MPLLEDLYNALLDQDEPEAKHVATALEIYVHGSLNVFNHRTNVELTNRLVCYDIKDLGKQLKKIGMLVVHRISDQICLEHGLSVIKPRSYKVREKYTDFPKKKTLRSGICEAIEAAILSNPRSFEELLLKLEELGFEIKRGKNIAVKGPGQKRFIRLNSLDDGYTEKELRRLFESVGERNIPKNPKKNFDMLIDIQKKLTEGKGRGYENWATLFNVKQIAKTLLFLQEHEIRDYETLEEKEKCASGIRKD